MKKQEFLDELKTSLNGELSETAIIDNVRYYRDYIESEVAAGAAEDEVMQLLGDPRLIAKTIIETKEEPDGSRQGNGAEYYQRETQQEDYQQEGPQPHIKHVSGLKGGLILAGIIVVILMILSAVFRLITVFMPVILVIIIISFIFNNPRKR